MGKLVSCKECGHEIAESAKVCPNCGAKVKKPVYKRWWFWALLVVIIIALMPDTRTDSGKDTQPTQEVSQPELTQKEKATNTYTLFHSAVKSAEDQMTELKDNSRSLGDNYTIQDLHDYCEAGIEKCTSARKSLDSSIDPEMSDEFKSAAYDYIANVEAAHIKMRDFLESGEQEDLDYVTKCIDSQNAYALSYVAAQQKYLMDSGFSTDEISEIIKN